MLKKIRIIIILLYWKTAFKTDFGGTLLKHLGQYLNKSKNGFPIVFSKSDFPVPPF